MELEFMMDAPTNNGELFIYFDKEGLELFIRAIDAARKDGHEHLFSQQWGGADELSVSDGSKNSFHKVTITYVTDTSCETPDNKPET